MKLSTPLSLLRIALCCFSLLVTGFSVWPESTFPSHRIADRSSTDSGNPYPRPTQGMLIRKDGEMSLLAMLDEFASITGEQMLYSEQAVIDLADSTTLLADPLRVAPEDVYRDVQAVLIQNDYFLIDVSRTPTRMMEVISLQWNEIEWVLCRARYVPEHKLATIADAQALLVTTVIDLPHLDFAVVPATTRPALVVPPQLQIIPVPTCSQVILTGFGKQLHDRYQELKSLDAVAANATAEHAPQSTDK